VSTSADSLIYKKMSASALIQISKLVSTGSCPELYPGRTILVRFESKILFYRVIEAWFDGLCLDISATELEPTSCHQLEGVALDNLLDSSIGCTQIPWINGYLGHAVEVSQFNVSL
jgi:hypothetical protein